MRNGAFIAMVCIWIEQRDDDVPILAFTLGSHDYMCIQNCYRWKVKVGRMTLEKDSLPNRS